MTLPVFVNTKKKLLFCMAFSCLSFSSFAETLDFISFSDVHLNTIGKRGVPRHIMQVNPAGPTDSDPVDKKNDLDTQTLARFTSLIQDKVNNELKDSKFFIITGDLAGHTSEPSNRADFIKAGFESLNTQLGIPLGRPILFVPGNNDSMVRDYGPYTNDTAKLAIEAGWNDSFLSRGGLCASAPDTYPCIVEENTKDNAGNFVAMLAPNLKLIGLNSVLFGTNAATSHVGADEELAWFDAQIKAIKPGESALLAMHIGPSRGWEEAYLNKFNATLAQNPGKIIGILAGHSHMANINGILLIKKGSKQTEMIPVINTPGLCTFYGNAPGFNHFSLIRKSAQDPWVIKDFSTFSFIDNNQLTLNKYYSFNEAYCPGKPDLTLDKCLEANSNSRMNLNKDVVDKIEDRLTAGNPNYKTSTGFPTIYKIYTQ